jgi:GDPmannose 4,6-dehydratase
MWMMLQKEKPDNYLISTGETHSIRDFLEAAFAYAGIADREKYVKLDPSFARPAELFVLKGSSDKARKEL